MRRVPEPRVFSANRFAFLAALVRGLYRAVTGVTLARAMAIPAVVTAGDRGAAKAVYGESKVFLEIDGRPLVAHVVAVLQRVPEVSEVWVIGDAERLRAVFERADVRREIAKPLHILEQGRNLYENAWQSLPLPAARGRAGGPRPRARRPRHRRCSTSRATCPSPRPRRSPSSSSAGRRSAATTRSAS